jgi:hypothetical protein
VVDLSNRGLGGLHLATMTVALLFMMSPAILWASPNGFSPQRAGFSVKFKDEVSPYRVTGIFVLPDETLTLEVTDGTEKGPYILEANAGRPEQTAPNRWTWQSPGETGLYFVKIICPTSAQWMALNIFVMVPYSRLKGEWLNGYRIGKYPTVPLNELSIYRPPRGFIEVTTDNENVLVSPHFKIKQFLCKQDGTYPKYLVLRERLLFKLEFLLEKVNEEGLRCSTFHIMSGYRTPYYNQLIGNVQYSRHLWGGAADIFIDEDPEDGIMDDLNRDGKTGLKDAAVLYDIVDKMYGESFWECFVGGLGRYKETENHGPFVHVDVRGFCTRWGD